MGAAIGGGEGGGTPTSGVGRVNISGGTIYATSYTGAAIGGGQRGDAYVYISGGKINAYSAATGAVIGAGGGAVGGTTTAGIAQVQITGGDLNLKANLGAAIGHGGFQSGNVPNHSDAIQGAVTITGGTIFADFAYGSAVGSGQNNKVIPLLTIDHTADVMAFGRTISNFPGINTGDPGYTNGGYNAGDGYFVNANFDLDVGAADGLMFIFERSNPDVPFKVIEIPYAFRLFSFTTGSTSWQDFYIYTGTVSGGVNQIVRKDDHPEIYSVRKPFEYYENGHAGSAQVSNYYRSVNVKYGSGGTYVFRYPVTEIHVDVNGAPIAGIPTTVHMVPIGTAYGKQARTIDGYDYKGYKMDSAPGYVGDYTASSPENVIINKVSTIYLIYDVRRSTVDVTVSKLVSGNYANKTRQFAFTVHFTDSTGAGLGQGLEFQYTGSIIPGEAHVAPPGGTLRLDERGGAGFTLAHGQSITIAGVPVDAYIRIDEAPDSNYETSFTDTKGAPGKNTVTTGPRLVGEEDREFRFTNERIIIIPTGIVTSTRAAGTLIIFLAAAVIPAMAIKMVFKKKTQANQ
ncbi:MAG: hypothetical protein FWH01_14060 [Oscillospiraceae bacterium]|nr:hypothetical protein [Oscillospiraceae bacterium]